MAVLRFVRSVCVVLVVSILSTMALAQSSATADLRGVVRDPGGNLVPNAAVTAREEEKNIERATSTNNQGEFQLLSLPPGIYTLTVAAPGFSTFAGKNIVLTVGQQAGMAVDLKVAASTQVIEVDTATDVVETQRSAQSTTVDQQRIDNLPTNGRNYVQFTLTNSQTARDTAPSIGAAPTSGINIGGQRARSNLVNVDGADAVDNSVNGIRSTVSQEAVQEFQILTNGYAAEYGRASGGVVNIITRSGSNDMHGTFYAYLRNRNLQATNPFSTVHDPAYTRVQPGFTLSGPIKKDRTFYFLSYEKTHRRESGFTTIGSNNFGLVNIDASRFFGAPAGSVNIQGTPAQATTIAALPVNAGTRQYVGLVGSATGTAVNGAAPLALGGARSFVTSGASLPTSFVPLTSLIGNYPIREETSIYGLRIDHRLSDHHQLMLRGNASPSDVTGIQVNAQNQNFGQNSFSRTSTQNYHDWGILGQETWTLGNNKINEFRYQYARRGLRYDFSRAPGGSNVAVNIPGFAFFGREPFSFVDRVEQRQQVTDNFSWNLGNHGVKFGVDYNHLPIQADFTVNFGGLFNFGELAASSLGFPAGAFPNFSPVQAYGLGIPQSFVQGIGNPHDSFTNNLVGVFLQDSWRLTPSFTINYGVRYDVEFTHTATALNALSQAAQNALGITKGLPKDNNNIAPRIGFSWDPYKDGKTVIRGSYGMFYDHPPLAVAFDSDVADGTKAPQLVFGGGSPCALSNPATSANPLNLNATNIFQGILTNGNCIPAAFAAGLQYLPSQQRFASLNVNSTFTNQNYLSPTSGFPLANQPFGFPIASNFQYPYSEQASLGFEHQFGSDYSLSLAYNFNGGHHLNRPINVNPVYSELLVANWERAVAAGAVTNTSDPRLVSACGVGPRGPYVPAAVVSFFRPSGLNPSLAPGVPAACLSGVVAPVLTSVHFGQLGTIPFSDMIANLSNGSSVYHGFTTNFKKRFSDRLEFLASYTWSHAMDDSTDLQSLLAPQDSRLPSQERSESTFDQRHRMVFSGVFQGGKVGSGAGWSWLLSDWTLAPLIEFSSGRPFNILVGSDQNFDFGPNTDRPLAVAAGTPADRCGNTPVASKYSPTGYLQATCYNDGVYDGNVTVPLIGNLKRNAGLRPWTVFNDMRIARRFNLGERLKLDGSVDIFNIANRFNVADVNPLYTQAGQPSASFDPRQFQLGLKLSF